MRKNKKGLVLSISGIIGLIIITVGVTYAFFNYVKQGTTENSITTGTITFLYTETSGVGRGISLSDAYPISDEVGKAQTGEGNVFDFKVTSTTPTNASIPYEITARKKDTSTLDESAVKLYLTKVSGDSEEEVLLDNYSNLTQTTKVSADKYIEKTLYTSKVPANSTSYEQAYRLRMWIDEDIDFSPVEDSDGNITYPYNDKEFTVTINVYANAKVVTDEDIALESNANISSLSVDDTELTAVEGQDYDYETSLPEGTTSTTINVETENLYATVNIEKLDSLAYNSYVKRLSASKKLELNEGDNYFKVTVTSENKEIANEFIIKINVLVDYDYIIGQAVTTIDGNQWHVLENSKKTDDKVVLLSDYNLNDDGSYNTTCGKSISGDYICNSMVFDPDNTIIYDESDSNNIGYFIKNTYQPLVISALPGTIDITLPTVEQIQNVDNITVDLSSNKEYKLSSDWLITTSYYTKTANTYYSYYVWAIYAKSTANDIRTVRPVNGDSIYGARPVITTPKTNILSEE